MKYLIDTCVISELISADPNKNVLQWMGQVDEEDLYLSVLTIGEIKKGIAKLKESKKKRSLIDWLQQLESRFKNKMINIDLNVIEIWGQKTGELETKGQKLPVIDGLIACTALSKNLTVVTRNERDMAPCGVEVYNPW